MKLNAKCIACKQNAINQDSGILKYLGEELKRNPEQLRCDTTDQCVAQVRKGSTAYIFVSQRQCIMLNKSIAVRIVTTTLFVD